MDIEQLKQLASAAGAGGGNVTIDLPETFKGANVAFYVDATAAAGSGNSSLSAAPPTTLAAQGHAIAPMGSFTPASHFHNAHQPTHPPTQQPPHQPPHHPYQAHRAPPGAPYPGHHPM